MHPFLKSRRLLLLYLFAWIPIMALLVALTWWDGTPWQNAAAALAPACVIYAFICLSPLYICRARPLRFTNAPGLVVTFGAASIAASLLFVGCARLAAFTVAQTTGWGGPDRRLPANLVLWFGMGVLLYLLSSGLHYAGLAVEASREAERLAGEARTLAREAELQALRMQINPHFLFNSLHSIAALATQDGARAREMCVRLADFLRSSLKLGDRDAIPLTEELALARSYLEVEQVRFGKRLRVEERIEPECDSCGIPALLLQPLVENAVKHGVAGMVEGGSIRLSARRSGSAVVITMENAFDAESPSPSKMGLGLIHVRRRLEVRYGEEASFDAGPDGGVYRVVLRLPCESPMTSSKRA